MPAQKGLATMDDGATRAVSPVANKDEVFELGPGVLKHANPIFTGDVRRVAFNALELN